MLLNEIINEVGMTKRAVKYLSLIHIYILGLKVMVVTD